MMRRTQHIKIRTKSSADNGNSKGERPVIGVNSRRPGGRPGVSEGGTRRGRSCWSSLGGGCIFF